MQINSFAWVRRFMPNLSRLCCKLTIIIIWSVVSLAVHADRQATADEPKLRAAIVLGIIRYSSWPDDVDMSGQLNLCSIGAPQSEQILTQVNGQHKYHDLAIMVFPLSKSQPKLEKCHALIIGPALDNKSARYFIERNGSHGLLTICDGCQINRSTAMVTLVRRDKRIAFHVDLALSNSAGISFSSALLELALKVSEK